MKGGFHFIHVILEVGELGQVRLLRVVHVEWHTFNGGRPRAAVGTFVFLEYVSAFDLFRVGGEVSEALYVYPFFVPFDFFHQDVDSPVIGHGDSSLVSVEEDFDVAGSHPSEVSLGLSRGFVDDSISHQRLV